MGRSVGISIRLADAAVEPELQLAWRREVRRTKGTDEERTSRAGVQAAKVALGERGTPWWEQTDAERRARWEVDVPGPGERS